MQVFTFGHTLGSKITAGVWEREAAGFSALHRQGIEEIYLLTYQYQDFFIVEKGKKEGTIPNWLHALPYPKWLKGKAGKLLYAFIAPYVHQKKIKELDLIKSNQTNGAWVASAIARKFNKVFLYRTGYTITRNMERDGAPAWMYRLFSWLEKKGYRQCNAATVTSFGDKDYIVKRYGIPENKIHVVTNFVDIDLFNPEPKVSSPITDRLFFVGRLTYAKNLEALIEACSRLGLGLDLAGLGEDEEALKSLVAELNADVTFLGKVPQSELPSMMRQYRYFILPSHFEGMPKALLEAMACGMCCFGTHVSGIKEVIKDGVNGILIPETDASSIETVLKKLHHSDAEKLGKQARVFIENYHSLEGLAEKEVALMKHLLGTIEQA